MNISRGALIVLVLASGLTACASPQEPGTRSDPQMPMKRGGAQMPMGDMEQMCDMHQKMMAGKSTEEQQAMMEQHMKAMHGDVDPQMAARHREMMEKNCQGPSQRKP